MPQRSLSSPTDLNALDQWRQKNGITQTDLAELLGVRQPTASRYCRPLDHVDFQVPAPVVAAKLPEITGGEVHIGMLIPAPSRATKRAARRASPQAANSKLNKFIPPAEPSQ